MYGYCSMYLVICFIIVVESEFKYLLGKVGMYKGLCNVVVEK